MEQMLSKSNAAALKEKLEQCELIMLDFDGTLLDSMPMWDHVGTDYILSQGITPPVDMEQKLVSKTLEQSGEYYINELGLEKTVEEYIADIYAFVEDRYRNELPLKNGVIEFVSAICEKNKNICILTTTGKPLVKAAMEHYGLERMINHVFTCGELGMSKTKPDIYAHVAGLMGSSTERAIVFEDAPFAIMNAKQAGCTVVSVFDPTAERQAEMIEAFADFRIRDMMEAYSII